MMEIINRITQTKDILEKVKKITKKEDLNELSSLKEQLKNLQVPEKQQWDNSETEFDCDSSPMAWQYFFKYYKIVESKSINDLKLNTNRLTIENENYEVAGDCSFNFNGKKFEYFKGIIDNEVEKKAITKEKKEVLKFKLNICEMMHHNLLNFDLMLVSGAMNNLKGHLKYKNGRILVHDVGGHPKDLLDRLDTFVCFFDESMKKLNDLKNKLKNKEETNVKEFGEFFSNSIYTSSLKGENFGTLFDSLEKYHGENGIYDYCEDFYGINDNEKNRAFIKKRLIESGKTGINDVAKLEKYLNLAIDYWILKANIFTDKQPTK